MAARKKTVAPEVEHRPGCARPRVERYPTRTGTAMVLRCKECGAHEVR